MPIKEPPFQTVLLLAGAVRQCTDYYLINKKDKKIFCTTIAFIKTVYLYNN